MNSRLISFILMILLGMATIAIAGYTPTTYNPPAPSVPVIAPSTPAPTPTIPSSPAIPKITAAPQQPDISKMTGEEIAKCLQDTRRCAGMIANQLRRLNPAELARALNLARTGSGGRKALQIDLTSLTDKARFDPKTGSLSNGRATVNIFQLGDSMKVTALKDGRIKVQGAAIDGILEADASGPKNTLGQLFTVKGAVDGIVPSTDSKFSLKPDHKSGGTTLEFVSGSKIDRIDPTQEATITVKIPADRFKDEDGRPIKPDKPSEGSLTLPGGHVLSSGHLITRNGKIYAPESLKTANNPVIDRIEIESLGGDLLISFDKSDRSKSRYAYIAPNMAEVKGEGSKIILRDGNSIIKYQDTQEDKQYTKNPLDYISISSQGGTATILPQRDPTRADVQIIGKATCEDGFWQFTSDGQRVKETPISKDPYNLRNYDAVQASVSFRKTASSSPSYSITVADNPPHSVDVYYNNELKSWINIPAKSLDELRARMISAMERLKGAPIDSWDGIGMTNTKDNEWFLGTQVACVDVGCVAASWAGSPYKEDLRRWNQNTGTTEDNAFQFRRNAVLAKYMDSRGLLNPLGKEDIQAMIGKLPKSYLNKYSPSAGRSNYIPQPGDVMFFNAYKGFNANTGQWTDLYPQVHSVVVASVKNGKPYEIWTTLAYDAAEKLTGTRFSSVYKVKLDEWVDIRKNPADPKSRRLYVPAAYGTFPDARHIGSYRSASSNTE